MPSSTARLLREGIITGRCWALAALIALIFSSRSATPDLRQPWLGQGHPVQQSQPGHYPGAGRAHRGLYALHIGAFIGFGIAVTHLVHWPCTPLVRFGLMIVAVVFELFFFMVTSRSSPGPAPFSPGGRSWRPTPSP